MQILTPASRQVVLRASFPYWGVGGPLTKCSRKRGDGVRDWNKCNHVGKAVDMPGRTGWFGGTAGDPWDSCANFQPFWAVAVVGVTARILVFVFQAIRSTGAKIKPHCSHIPRLCVPLHCDFVVCELQRSGQIPRGPPDLPTGTVPLSWIAGSLSHRLTISRRFKETLDILVWSTACQEVIEQKCVAYLIGKGGQAWSHSGLSLAESFDIYI